MAANSQGDSSESIISKLKQSGGHLKAADLAQYIENDLKTVFKEREKFALINMLDVNKSSEIDLQFFAKEMKRASYIGNDPTQQKIVLESEIKRELKPPKKQDLRASRGPAELPDPTRPVTGGSVRSVVPGAVPQESNLATIMRKIQGQTTMSDFLLTALEKCWNPEGRLKLNDFKGFVESTYSRMLTAKEILLLIRSMDSNLDQRIDLQEFREVNSRYLVFQEICS